MATGANGQRTYDPVTTQNMLAAFDTAQAECKTIQSGVDSAQALLASSYSGDAATRYQNSMSEWRSGFTRVQNALNMINESMGQYRVVTTTTETNNQSYGSGWAQGV
ncbi:WXG100 family type VII secretion target [Kineosporia succinea]|uniref:ESAT-6-like protein n=1 Tax=Kineosporia succinea TaxID=84632 RepID=A0ABT9P516_9ACTN|nr:WXG100 family type VII secretion target [Kineosporia succinea]MDP9827772.1 WXG100 family type VII secretion target [Kineosporia succinea]